MAVQFYSGIKSTAFNGTNELPTTDWSADATSDVVRFRNSKTNAYSNKEATFKDLRATIGFDFDFNENPFALQAIDPGTKLTTVNLYLHKTGTNDLYWHLPSAIVTGVGQRVSTEGKPEGTLTIENDGVFNSPGNTNII
jgi:hypothetical protein